VHHGDWLVALNGQTPGTVDDLHRRLAGVRAGSAVTLDVVRQGERRALTVTVGDT